MTNLHYPFLFLFLLFAVFTRAQTTFSDFIIPDKYIWGLTAEGKIKLFDSATGKPSVKKTTNDKSIISIAADRKGNVFIADECIKKYNVANNSWDSFASYHDKLYGIVLNSKERCYTITNKGITDCTDNKTYFPEQSHNHQIHYKEEWFRKPTYLIDHNDNIWLGFGYGEWGGDIFKFNTHTNTFEDPLPGNTTMPYTPIKSFFEDSNDVYYSEGLSHIGGPEGSINKIRGNKTEMLFESHSIGRIRVSDTSETREGEDIGYATYNTLNNCFYFVSQTGIYQGDGTKDLSKLSNWTRILGGYDPPSTLYKMIPLGNHKLIYLTNRAGIYYYDGENVVSLE